jgi:hypothetical protein
MKKLLLTIATAASFVGASAQGNIPNGGFETWTNAGTYEDPASWTTFNVLSNSLFGSNPVSVFKETANPHSGSFAARMTSVGLTSNPAPGDVPDTVGVMFTGAFNFVSTSVDFGYVFTSRPQDINWWSKYTPAAGGDSGFVLVALTHFNGTTTDTVAWGGAVINTEANWTQHTSTLYYNPLLPANTFPDTCIILCSATDDTYLRAGSTLWIDDMSFSGWVGLDETPAQREEVAVFPNPATENVTFTVNNDNASRVQIYDMTGRMISDEMFTGRRVQLSTDELASGMYTYTILDANDQTMNRGKFTVK